MYVENEVRIVQAHRRALAVLLVEVVGNGILYTICYELGVTENLAVHHRIDRESRIAVHILFPVYRLDNLIDLIGVGRPEVHYRFQDAHSRP